MVELGSEFLCAHLALTPEPRADHASYVETWLRVLRNDNLYRRRRQQRRGALLRLHADRRPPGAHEVSQAAAAVRAAEPEPGEWHVARPCVDHLLQVRLGLMAARFAPHQDAGAAVARCVVTHYGMMRV